MWNQRPASAVEFKHAICSKKVTLNIGGDGVCDACRQAEKGKYNFILKKNPGSGGGVPRMKLWNILT